MRKNTLFWVMAAACAVLMTLGLALPGPAQATSPPHCVTGTFTENSGNGPTFRNVSFCDVTSKTNYMVVDGGPLQNKAVIFGSHTTRPAVAQAGLSSDPLCWGHNGIHISGLIAAECIDQSGPGGATYWSANESNLNWDKHPSDGLLWTEASTLYPTPDANPPNPYQDFWVGIAHAGGTFCTVIAPGYDQKPTLCEFATLLTAANQGTCSAVIDPGSGQPKVCETVRIMSSRRQASYDQLAQSLISAKVPDCAWSMTVVSSQCDVDS